LTLGFVLWAYAVARMDVGRVTTGLYLVPAAAIVISLVWLGQVPGPVELGGGAIALAGVMLAGSRPRERRPRERRPRQRRPRERRPRERRPRDAGEVAEVGEPVSVR
jgi:drug/metabolite transporter (DMT)-like permease